MENGYDDYNLADIIKKDSWMLEKVKNINTFKLKSVTKYEAVKFFWNTPDGLNFRKRLSKIVKYRGRKAKDAIVALMFEYE